MPEAALRTIGLGKSFGAIHAVSNVTWDINIGELHALIGPNGAGKSTFINLVSGDLRATTGKVLIGGRDVTALSPDRRGLAGIGRSYQMTTIFPNFTVMENVRLAAQAHSSRALSLLGHANSDAETVQIAIGALDTVGLASRGEAPAAALSHGEQRALEIAMVLATKPRIVLLDEPLAGMGQKEAEHMTALIASLKEDRAILLVEHDMDAVFALADRLTVMADGRVIATGKPLDVRSNAAVREAYLGYGEGTAV